jgi:hypothetical protein
MMEEPSHGRLEGSEQRQQPAQVGAHENDIAAVDKLFEPIGFQEFVGEELTSLLVRRSSSQSGESIDLVDVLLPKPTEGFVKQTPGSTGVGTSFDAETEKEDGIGWQSGAHEVSDAGRVGDRRVVDNRGLDNTVSTATTLVSAFPTVVRNPNEPRMAPF